LLVKPHWILPKAADRATSPIAEPIELLVVQWPVEALQARPKPCVCAMRSVLHLTEPPPSRGTDFESWTSAQHQVEIGYYS
jgi:hypothetical protein